MNELFPDNFTQEQVAKAKTVFLKELAYSSHKFYGGKIATMPKAGVYGFNWFNVWYTPGVSKVSTTIRDDNDTSFDLSNRGNFVAVVSDSTRVLGDGDCTPAGGLGVMEGKAFLMKYLGGVDGVALCVNSYNDKGKHDPDKIIDFVKMAEPSFGAVNLEDISQPNCYKVLDTLREACNIPVWHDDAQGTGSVTLAGLINALRVVGKELKNVRIVFYGAGASNTTIARLIIQAGADPTKMIMFDTTGTLHIGRDDIKADPAFYRKWELCQKTNPDRVSDMDKAIAGADVLIALSKPGPDTIKPAWIKKMAPKAIVFACANPVPEIYPYAAKEAGAYHRGHRSRRLPQPGEQLAGLSRHPQGGAGRARQEDHRRDGHRRRLLHGQLRPEERHQSRPHHAHHGRDRGLRPGSGRRGHGSHQERRGQDHVYLAGSFRQDHGRYPGGSRSHGAADGKEFHQKTRYRDAGGRGQEGHRRGEIAWPHPPTPFLQRCWMASLHAS